MRIGTPENLMLAAVNSKNEVFVVGGGNVEGALTNRAKNVANYLVGVNSPDQSIRQNSRQMLTNMLTAVRCSTVEELFLNNSGDPRIEQAKFDWYDGLVLGMGTVFGGDQVSGTVKEAIKRGDAAAIDAVFVNPNTKLGMLKGAGVILADATIRDEKLANMVKFGQLAWKTQGGLERLFEQIGQAAAKGEVDYQQAFEVSAYLTAVIESRQREVEVKVANDKAAEKAAEEAQRRAEEARMRAERAAAVIEGPKKDFYQAMLLHRNVLNVDPFSNLAPEWMQGEDKVLIQTLVALSNAAFYKWRYGDSNLDVMADARGEANFSAPNEMMRKMYEMKGVRESMEYFVQEFFDLKTDPVSGVNLLELKRDVAYEARKAQADRDRREGRQPGRVGDDQVIDRLKNISTTREELMEDLIRRGVVRNETEALAAVSTAFNLLYVSHAFEGSDKYRRLKPCEVYVEQMRAFMHPASKARAKQIKDEKSVGTEEGWGGTLGQWLVGTLERARVKMSRGIKNDPDVMFAEQYRRGEVHPFPERLFESFLVLSEVAVDVGGGRSRETNLAEALYRGWKVDFEADGKGGNMWGAYADTGDSALKLYKACRGDEKAFLLPLGDSKAKSQVIDWAGNVADARNKLKGNHFLSQFVNTAEFVKWTIAACTRGGLYPSAELVLMTPNVEGRQDFSLDMLFNSRALVTDAEAEQIKKDFHADGYTSKFARSRIRGLRF